jgi:hypothetical protein
MEIIIDNVPFAFDMGAKVCKVGNIEIVGLDLTNVEPITFEEISMLRNIEQRRVAIKYFGTEKLIADINPELVSSETISKSTTYIDDKGVSTTINFQDTYELYKVSAEKLFGKQGSHLRDEYYVKCKDTSTDRDYIIWVDVESVARANNISVWGLRDGTTKIDAIQAIAWTIQTDVKEGNIRQIIRQGDCVFVEPIDTTFDTGLMRSITKEEYINLLKTES